MKALKRLFQNNWVIGIITFLLLSCVLVSFGHMFKMIIVHWEVIASCAVFGVFVLLFLYILQRPIHSFDSVQTEDAMDFITLLEKQIDPSLPYMPQLNDIVVHKESYQIGSVIEIQSGGAIRVAWSSTLSMWTISDKLRLATKEEVIKYIKS
jgi:hypothetical protein